MRSLLVMSVVLLASSFLAPQRKLPIGLFKRRDTAAVGSSDESPTLAVSTRTLKDDIQICMNRGQWERGLQLLGSVAMSVRDQGSSAYASTFAAAIQGVGENGQWRRCLQLLTEDMPRLGLAPDTRCYAAAFGACAAAGEWEKALELLDTMDGMGGFSDELGDAEPTANKRVKARKLVMRSAAVSSPLFSNPPTPFLPPKPDAACFGAVIAACTGAGQWGIALDLMKAMQDKSMKPGHEIMQNALVAHEGNEEQKKINELRAAITFPARPKRLTKEKDKDLQKQQRERESGDLTTSPSLAPAKTFFYDDVLLPSPNSSSLGGVVVVDDNLSVLRAVLGPGTKATKANFESAIKLCARRIPPKVRYEEEVAERVKLAGTVGRPALRPHRTWDNAIRLLRDMLTVTPLSLGSTNPNAITPSLTTCNHVLSACRQGGQWRWCLELIGLYDDLDLAAGSEGDADKDQGGGVERVGVGILQVGVGGNEGEASEQEVLGERPRGMWLAFGVRPNRASLNHALGVCAAHGRWREALRLLDACGSNSVPGQGDINERGVNAAALFGGVLPDTLACNLAITACANAYLLAADRTGTEKAFNKNSVDGNGKRFAKGTGINHGEGYLKIRAAALANDSSLRYLGPHNGQDKTNGLVADGDNNDDTREASGAWAGALAVLESMQAGRWSSSNGINGATPDVVSVSAAMGACSRASHRFHLSLELFDAMFGKEQRRNDGQRGNGDAPGPSASDATTLPPLFRLSRGHYLPDAAAFNSALHACAEWSKCEAVEFTFATAPLSLPASSLPLPDMDGSTGALMSPFSATPSSNAMAMRAWRRALSIVEDMKPTEKKTRTSEWGSSGEKEQHANKQGGNEEKGDTGLRQLQVLDAQQQQHQQQYDERVPTVMEAKGASAAIRACGYAGEWRRALALLETQVAFAVEDREARFKATLKQDKADLSLFLRNQRHQKKQQPQKPFRKDGGRLLSKQTSKKKHQQRTSEPGSADESEFQFGGERASSDANGEDSKEGLFGRFLDGGVFDAALVACAQSGRWREALSLLQTMAKGEAEGTAMGNWGITVSARSAATMFTPNVHSLSAVVQACARDGGWRVAAQLVLGMEATWGVKPSMEAFNSALAAVAQHSRHAEDDGAQEQETKRTIKKQGVLAFNKGGEGPISLSVESDTEAGEIQMLHTENISGSTTENGLLWSSSPSWLLYGHGDDLCENDKRDKGRVSLDEKGGGGFVQIGTDGVETALMLLDAMRAATANNKLGSGNERKHSHDGESLASAATSGPDEMSFWYVLRCCERRGAGDTALQLLDDMRFRFSSSGSESSGSRSSNNNRVLDKRKGGRSSSGWAGEGSNDLVVVGEGLSVAHVNAAMAACVNSGRKSYHLAGTPTVEEIDETPRTRSTSDSGTNKNNGRRDVGGGSNGGIGNGKPMWDRALFLFDMILSKSPRKETASPKETKVKAASSLLPLSSFGVSPNVQSYRLAMAACLQGGGYARAVELMRRCLTASSGAPIATTKTTGASIAASGLLLLDGGVVSLALAACDKGGLWMEAIEIVDLVLENAMNPADTGPSDSPLPKRRQDRLSLVPAHFSAAIGACDKGGQWEAALTLLHTMEAAAAQGLLLPDNDEGEEKAERGRVGAATNSDSRQSNSWFRDAVVPYNRAITCLGKSGRLTEALKVLDGLRTRRSSVVAGYARGLAYPLPNQWTYNAALRECAREGNAEKAMSVLSSMAEDMAMNKNAVGGVGPSTSTLNLVMTACGRAGEWQTALDLFLAGFHTGNWANVAAAYSASVTADTSTRASSVGEKAGVGGGALSGVVLSPDVASVELAVCALGESGRWREAVDMLGRMKKVQGHEQTQNRQKVGVPVGGGKKAKKGKDVIESQNEPEVWKAEKRRPSAKTQRMAETGDMFTLDQRAISLAAVNVSAVGPDASLVRACVGACGRGGAWQDALKLLESMPTQWGLDPCAHVEVVTAAVSACEVSGAWDVALRLFDMSFDIGPSTSSSSNVGNGVPSSLVVTSSCDLPAFLQDGGGGLSSLRFASGGSDGVDGGDIALNIASQGGERDKRRLITPDVPAFNAAMRACSRGRSAGRALGLLVAIQAKGLRPTLGTFRPCLRAFEREGQWQRALSLLSFMEAPNFGVRPDPACFQGAMRACGKGGQWRRALGLLLVDLPAKAAATKGQTKASLLREAAAIPAGNGDGGHALSAQSVHAAMGACACAAAAAEEHENEESAQQLNQESESTDSGSSGNGTITQSTSVGSEAVEAWKSLLTLFEAMNKQYGDDKNCTDAATASDEEHDPDPDQDYPLTMAHGDARHDSESCLELDCFEGRMAMESPLLQSMLRTVPVSDETRRWALQAYGACARLGVPLPSSSEATLGDEDDSSAEGDIHAAAAAGWAWRRGVEVLREIQDPTVEDLALAVNACQASAVARRRQSSSKEGPGEIRWGATCHDGDDRQAAQETLQLLLDTATPEAQFRHLAQAGSFQRGIWKRRSRRPVTTATSARYAR